MKALVENPKTIRRSLQRQPSCKPSTRAAFTSPGTSFSAGSKSCACGGGCPRCAGVQAKLKVNPPGDRYEQEADSLADQLMRMPAPAIQRAPT